VESERNQVSRAMSNSRPAIAVASWRRPHLLRELLNLLPADAASCVHIGIDGPPMNPGLQTNWLATCDVARDFQRNAPMPVTIRVSVENAGSARNVLAVVREASQLAESVIVLEDDCRPTDAFLHWAPEMLSRYRANPGVWAVCGSQYAPPDLMERGHVLSRHFLGWGWAVESSRWPSMERAIRTRPTLSSPAGSTKAEDVFWYHGARRAFEGYVDAWDAPLLQAMRRADARCVLPRENLVANVGFGEEATHTKSATPGMLTPAVDRLPWDTEPDGQESARVDQWLAAHHFGISSRHRVTTRVTQLLDMAGAHRAIRPCLEDNDPPPSG
jgi:hypothetical protein